jgi:hypothetical protein
LLLKKNNTYHHHHLWLPRALALNTPFSLAPPFPSRPLPSLLTFPLPVSFSRTDAPEGHVSSVEVR